MADEDVRQFLNRKQPQSKAIAPRMVVRRPQQAQKRSPQSTYENFSATHLFCPTCRQATPVREKLLLYLGDGDLYGYSCTVCGTSVGTRKAGQDLEPA